MKTPIEAIPTLFGGVQYRSRLEARFAQFLTDQQVLFSYEPDTFETIPDTGYVPDFHLRDGDIDLYIEIKPHAFFREMDLFKDAIQMSQMKLACVDSPSRGLWRMYWMNPALWSLMPSFPQMEHFFTFAFDGLWSIRFHAEYFDVNIDDREVE
jgi:hypothetical protein